MSKLECPKCGAIEDVDVDDPSAACPACRAPLFGPVSNAATADFERSSGAAQPAAPWARKWLYWMSAMLAAWGGIGGFLMYKSAQAVHESLDGKSPDAKALHPVTGREARVGDLLAEMDAELRWFFIGHFAVAAWLILLALVPGLTLRKRILAAGVAYAAVIVAMGIAFPGTLGAGIVLKVIFFATFGYALKSHRAAA
jgi:hypothetical protein